MSNSRSKNSDKQKHLTAQNNIDKKARLFHKGSYAFVNIEKKSFFVKSKRKIFLGLGLIVIGFIFILIPLIYSRFSYLNSIQNIKPEFDAFVSKTKKSYSSEPISIDSKLLGDVESTQEAQRIVIPSVDIDLPISEAPVVSGYWQLSDTTASHGVGSANPGQLGNTVIFAHARVGLFLPLKDVNVGDNVYILTKDHWHRYQVSNITFVNPDQTEVIKPTKNETLTLYTCSGFLDAKRLIVVAKPIY